MNAKIITESVAALIARGISSEDLDETIYDIFCEKTSIAYNHCADGEDILDAAEVEASDINNGGMESQVEAIFEHCGIEDGLRILSEISPE